MRQFAITDIHGCRQTFEALLDKIGLSLSDELYLLGDYLDRGPDSKGVIDLILKMRNEGYKINCLRGNHEDMFLELAAKSNGNGFNFYPGLVETLVSYRCRHPRDLPSEHLEFLSSLEYYFETDEFLLVHAGINFDAADPLNDQCAMLWERFWYSKVDKNWLNGKIILHGHTPIPIEEVLRMYNNLEEISALNLDCGCVYNLKGMHQLTAFDMTNHKLYFQENVD